MEAAEARGVRILVPTDVVIAESLDSTHATTWPSTRIPPIKPSSTSDQKPSHAIAEQIAGARTVFWNGPMGVFERKPFANGTLGIARCVADCHAHTPSSAAATRWRQSRRPASAERIDHVSTGGGASLEYLEGRDLPGIAALPDA